jgi:hypothetical protein
MKKWLLLSCALVTASGCAFRGDVHRMGVDFNSTIAKTANELTLLNVLRAKDHHPLHFTSYSAVRGKIHLTGGATVGSTIQGNATTDTTKGTEFTRQIVEGVESFTPGLSTEISTGPDFDVAVYDTQEFYQGITTSFPPETIAHLLYQGWRSDLLSYLLVERVNFTLENDIYHTVAGKQEILFPKGTIVRSIETLPHDRDQAEQFDQIVRCYELSPVAEPAKATDLAPASRLGKELKLEDLHLLDGKALDLSGTLGADPASDKAIIQRPGKPKDRLTVFPYDEEHAPVCAGAAKTPLFAQALFGKGRARRDDKSRDLDEHSTPVTLGTYTIPETSRIGKALKATGNSLTQSVNMEFTFRSVQGVFDFLGDYLRTDDDGGLLDAQGNLKLYAVERSAGSRGKRIFDVTEDPAGRRVLVAARHLGKPYYIVADSDENYAQSLRVLALLQQLVNLQKKASDKPATQSVRLLN